MTQLALPVSAVMCDVIHLDEKQRPATHRAWTLLEPEHVSLVCASCARMLVNLRWVSEAIEEPS
jgi:hypothetical protein